MGYSPFLTFTVAELQTTLTQLLQLGSTMDGSVKHLPRGLVRTVAGFPLPACLAVTPLLKGKVWLFNLVSHADSGCSCPRWPYD